jgi:hypothetical protein
MCLGTLVGRVVLNIRSDSSMLFAALGMVIGGSIYHLLLRK